MSSEIIVAQDLALLLRKLHCRQLPDDRHICVNNIVTRYFFQKIELSQQNQRQAPKSCDDA